MEHVVFFPSAEGLPSFRRVNSVDEAVSFVEHLRNVEGTTEFSVHALTSVPLSFRAYYRVEVPPADSQPPAQESSPSSAEPYSWLPASAPAGTTPAAPADPDRSAAWVAEAAVVEAPASAPVAEVPAAPTAPAEKPAAAPVADLFAASATTSEPAPTAAADAPFADAPPVTPPGSDSDVLPDPDAVPASGSRRSMGFFSR